uniref:Uncharacterized protein n=1 Tax=Candidatus Kentrum sp. TC TaxID=2126339 RepID=A0A450Z1T9_9GAMM|nr:MAG: hypothetical protein BECKTC1821E_GA0114239_104121 [Candidatus Kentron sp. TC]VFK47760.1 MAG: hypothetical protein BECKTC1821D_GA0114238_105110 [Candidatus Kentron sp. TC]VFK58976.1 MAG: hypothetical protein BECKTC1821F_GA0114240_102813 [Candidatus Kentron sp. TC]
MGNRPHCDDGEGVALALLTLREVCPNGRQRISSPNIEIQIAIEKNMDVRSALALEWTKAKNSQRTFAYSVTALSRYPKE